MMIAFDGNFERRLRKGKLPETVWLRKSCSNVRLRKRMKYHGFCLAYDFEQIVR